MKTKKEPSISSAVMTLSAAIAFIAFDWGMTWVGLGAVAVFLAAPYVALAWWLLS